jgi:hypothetical protein
MPLVKRGLRIRRWTMKDNIVIGNGCVDGADLGRCPVMVCCVNDVEPLRSIGVLIN